jgi:hypothetical protein
MDAAERALPRRDFSTASRFALYALMRLAVISASGVCSPNSALRCLAMRSSSSRDRFRAFDLKYRSNASARVSAATVADAAAGSGCFSASSASCASVREK